MPMQCPSLDIVKHLNVYQVATLNGINPIVPDFPLSKGIKIILLRAAPHNYVFKAGSLVVSALNRRTLMTSALLLQELRHDVIWT